VTGGAQAAAAIATGAVAACLSVPASIAIARRSAFLDHPREYRRHRAPTPLLGGAAVLAAVLVAAGALGAIDARWAVALGCAIGLWGLGTLDDRSAVAPKWRLLAEAAAGVALFAAGLRFRTPLGDVADLALTVAWVIAVVNAFNLMDNLDGACGSVTVAAAAGLGVLATVGHDTTAAVTAFALAGACAAFLRWNLAQPSRQFLGDGGSMPIGLLVAAAALALTGHAGITGPLGAALLAGLPLLDTTLVSVSRTRRRVPLVTGGRDHLSHRLLGVLSGPRRVALILCAAQAGLSALGVASLRIGSGAVLVAAGGAVLVGAVAIAVLDSPRWRPAGIATGEVKPGTRASARGLAVVARTEAERG
jgi:UDP-GlcNAc:undecaprenyl-phosphate/decaprenyl-phosphate GlcNAc-1-phosphate transferase